MVNTIVTVIFWAFIAVFVLGILGTMLLPFITAWSWISLTRSERKLARAERDHALQQRA
jgi:hypothetical protein